MKYIVKNTITNEISEQDIPQAFIDQLLEVGQDYSGFIKATQEEVDSFNQGKIDKELEEAKKTKKALVDTMRDRWVIEAMVKAPIVGGFISLKIDANTRSELTQVNQGFIAGIINVANFGDAVDKTTKQINQKTILNYFGLVDNALNGSTSGVYLKARAIKAQINDCQSIAEVEAVVIEFL
jgi:hypothetical protein